MATFSHWNLQRRSAATRVSARSLGAVTASTPQARGEPVLDLVPAISMGGELVLELQRLHTRGAGARGDGHAPWGVQPFGLTNFLNGIFGKKKKKHEMSRFSLLNFQVFTVRRPGLAGKADRRASARRREFLSKQSQTA
jgi:hypothetical protein